MKQKKKKETKDTEGFIEIPFGAFDSETMGWTYTIPEGFTAKIEDGKIIVEKKESEDERIRKELIQLLSKMTDGIIENYTPIPLRDFIAYLEKQKEPLPIPDKFSGLKSLMLQFLQSAVNRKDDTEIESDIDLSGRKILDYVWKCDGLQKEQKPTVNIDNFKSFMMQYLQDAANRKTDSEIEADTDKWAKKLLNLIEVKEQKPAEIDEYKIIKKHITEDSLSSEVNKRLKECGWYVTDDKPVEWSEADEKIIESLLRHFRKKYKTKPYWNGIAVKDIIAYLEKQKDAEIEIEKAYKNADKIQYEKGFEDGIASVKPSEWSEEDELMRTVIIQTLERFGGRGTTGMQIDWLKSLRPQPHWKPSEEQMDALYTAAQEAPIIKEDGNYLYDLYDDLKKL